MEKIERAYEQVNKIKIKPRGIIAGSPGIGKSTLLKHLPEDIKVLDLEPTPYTQAEDWPNNYIEEIINNVNNTDLILITTNPAVVRELIERGLPVSIVSPDESLKDEYRQRYINRGNKPEIVERIIEKAHKTNNEITADFEGCDVIFLQSGQYLLDVIDFEGTT